MIIFSYWFNPAKHRQLEARIHRRGQTAQVDVYNVVAESTIDEAILRLHEDKTLCSAMLLDGVANESNSDQWKRFGRIVSICRPLKPLEGAMDPSPTEKGPSWVRRVRPRTQASVE